MSAKLRAQTHYRLSFPNRNGHLIEIDARFSGTLGQAEVVNHPVWTPGSYLIREYTKNIEELTAVNDAGKSLPLERLNKASWRVQNAGQPFHIKYRHYANELSVRNAHVDASHCFFTPAAILVYAPSLANASHEVEVVLPADWTTVSTPLPAKGKVFTAANLDELMDSPFEIGSHKEQAFLQDGVKYRLASYPANLSFSPANLADIRRVVHQANQVFAPAPLPVQGGKVTGLG
jgi:predicted metalloprotease with PDZ domain